ncbi:MAG TPA: hypothetical protein VLB68_00005 [Pyrinomonadaceae bacterium]|nr:hypothetical protein [Pyrinomonadaceae bacterium]
MVTFLFTSLLLLGLVVLAVYLWQKPASSTRLPELSPPKEPRSLFDYVPAKDELTPIAMNLDHSKRAELLERAAQGDRTVLSEAHQFSEPEIYEEVLNELVAHAKSQSQIVALMSYVSRHNLKVNKAMVDVALDAWKLDPTKNATSKMLHTAALTDDADIYLNAIESVLTYWREQKLSEISNLELEALFHAEFWVLSSNTRSSGNGFILKQTLSAARRELEERVDK